MNRTLISALVVAGLVASSAAQDAALPEVATITAPEIHGGGDWKTDGKAKLAPQRWNLDVRRNDDGAISGRVAVTDSPLLSAGNVQGKIDGQSISGTIIDDDGVQIATFQGSITSTGMNGKYTDRTGEVGTWQWDGELPR